MDLEIRPLKKEDLRELKEFTDRVIGTGYYSTEELLGILERSQDKGQMASLILVDPKSDKIMGLRLTYPPGKWLKGKGKFLSPHLWRTQPSETGYFQSLFLDPATQGLGWGQRLSEASAKILKSLGAKAIVCHSWVESPFDSSRKYLLKMGFEPLTRYPHYWKEVDYVCTRCGKPCLCTAEEMIYYL